MDEDSLSDLLSRISAMDKVDNLRSAVAEKIKNLGTPTSKEALNEMIVRVVAQELKSPSGNVSKAAKEEDGSRKAQDSREHSSQYHSPSYQEARRSDGRHSSSRPHRKEYEERLARNPSPEAPATSHSDGNQERDRPSRKEKSSSYSRQYASVRHDSENQKSQPRRGHPYNRSSPPLDDSTGVYGRDRYMESSQYKEKSSKGSYSSMQYSHPSRHQEDLPRTSGMQADRWWSKHGSRHARYEENYRNHSPPRVEDPSVHAVSYRDSGYVDHSSSRESHWSYRHGNSTTDRHLSGKEHTSGFDVWEGHETPPKYSHNRRSPSDRISPDWRYGKSLAKDKSSSPVRSRRALSPAKHGKSPHRKQTGSPSRRTKSKRSPSPPPHDRPANVRHNRSRSPLLNEHKMHESHSPPQASYKQDARVKQKDGGNSQSTGTSEVVRRNSEVEEREMPAAPSSGNRHGKTHPEKQPKVLEKLNLDVLDSALKSPMEPTDSKRYRQDGLNKSEHEYSYSRRQDVAADPHMSRHTEGPRTSRSSTRTSTEEKYKRDAMQKAERHFREMFDRYNARSYRYGDTPMDTAMLPADDTRQRQQVRPRESPQERRARTPSGARAASPEREKPDRQYQQSRDREGHQSAERSVSSVSPKRLRKRSRSWSRPKMISRSRSRSPSSRSSSVSRSPYRRDYRLASRSVSRSGSYRHSRSRSPWYRHSISRSRSRSRSVSSSSRSRSRSRSPLGRRRSRSLDWDSRQSESPDRKKSRSSAVICKHCGAEKRCLKHLWRHLAHRHADVELIVLKCHQGSCNFKTVSHEDLLWHAEKCKAGDESPLPVVQPSSFKCVFCDQKEDEEIQMWTHMAKAHGDKMEALHCPAAPKCSFMTVNETHLDDHKQSCSLWLTNKQPPVHSQNAPPPQLPSTSYPQKSPLETSYASPVNRYDPPTMSLRTPPPPTRPVGPIAPLPLQQAPPAELRCKVCGFLGWHEDEIWRHMSANHPQQLMVFTCGLGSCDYKTIYSENLIQHKLNCKGVCTGVNPLSGDKFLDQSQAHQKMPSSHMTPTIPSNQRNTPTSPAVDKRPEVAVTANETVPQRSTPMKVETVPVAGVGSEAVSRFKKMGHPYTVQLDGLVCMRCPSGARFCCPKCGFMHYDRPTIWKHIRTMHPEMRVFSCEERTSCSYITLKESQYKKHSEQCAILSKAAASKSTTPKVASSADSTAVVERSKGGPYAGKPLQEAVAKIKPRTYAELASGLLRIGESPKDGFLYACPICGFMDKVKLKTWGHFSTAHPQVKVFDPQSGCSFRTLRSDHLTQHQGECPKCSIKKSNPKPAPEPSFRESGSGSSDASAKLQKKEDKVQKKEDKVQKKEEKDVKEKQLSKSNENSTSKIENSKEESQESRTDVKTVADHSKPEAAKQEKTTDQKPMQKKSPFTTDKAVAYLTTNSHGNFTAKPNGLLYLHPGLILGKGGKSRMTSGEHVCPVCGIWRQQESQIWGHIRLAHRDHKMFKCAVEKCSFTSLCKDYFEVHSKECSSSKDCKS